MCVCVRDEEADAGKDLQGGDDRKNSSLRDHLSVFKANFKIFLCNVFLDILKSLGFVKAEDLLKT